MNKYILGIEGMRCGMCEINIERAIENKIKNKKAKASHKKNLLIVISEEELSLEDFKSALKETGYKIISFSKEEARKTFLGWK